MLENINLFCTAEYRISLFEYCQIERYVIMTSQKSCTKPLKCDDIETFCLYMINKHKC